MQITNFGESLLDAVQADIVMAWPTWSHEHPVIWALPAMALLGAAGTVWPKKSRIR